MAWCSSGDQLPAAFSSTTTENVTPCARAHPCKEAVNAPALCQGNRAKMLFHGAVL